MTEGASQSVPKRTLLQTGYDLLCKENVLGKAIRRGLEKYLANLCKGGLLLALPSYMAVGANATNYTKEALKILQNADASQSAKIEATKVIKKWSLKFVAHSKGEFCMSMDFIEETTSSMASEEVMPVDTATEITQHVSQAFWEMNRLALCVNVTMLVAIAAGCVMTKYYLEKGIKAKKASYEKRFRIASEDLNEFAENTNFGALVTEDEMKKVSAKLGRLEETFVMLTQDIEQTAAKSKLLGYVVGGLGVLSAVMFAGNVLQIGALWTTQAVVFAGFAVAFAVLTAVCAWISADAFATEKEFTQLATQIRPCLDQVKKHKQSLLLRMNHH